jgi:hypothetical protein
VAKRIIPSPRQTAGTLPFMSTPMPSLADFSL